MLQLSYMAVGSYVVLLPLFFHLTLLYRCKFKPYLFAIFPLEYHLYILWHLPPFVLTPVQNTCIIIYYMCILQLNDIIIIIMSLNYF